MKKQSAARNMLKKSAYFLNAILIVAIITTSTFALKWKRISEESKWAAISAHMTAWVTIKEADVTKKTIDTEKFRIRLKEQLITYSKICHDKDFLDLYEWQKSAIYNDFKFSEEEEKEVRKNVSVQRKDSIFKILKTYLENPLVEKLQ